MAGLRAEELPLAVVAREHTRRLPRGHRRGLRAVAVGGAGRGGGGCGGDGERQVEGGRRAGGGVGRLGVGRRLAADVGQLILTRFLDAVALHL